MSERKEHDMDATTLVERYIETWNERDPETRRSAIEALWTEDGSYVDPLASVAGYKQLSDLIAAVQAQAPGFVFRLIEERVDAHHNVVRFSWELVPESGGESVVIGFDVAVLDEDGRIRSVLGFLDKVPAHIAAQAGLAA
jgi:SnoaL-like domain